MITPVGVPTTCSSCGADIVFLRTKREGVRMPVNLGTWTQGEEQFRYAKHMSHFATCPQAKQWRGARGAAPTA